MLENIGGRKMAISVAVVIICLGVVLLKGDVPSGLAEMLKFILGSFIIGNVGSQLTGVAEQHVAAKAAASVAPAPLTPVSDPRIDVLLTKTDALIQTASTSQQGLAFIVERMAPRS